MWEVLGESIGVANELPRPFVGAASSVDAGFEKCVKADQVGSWILAMFLQGHKKVHVGDSALERPRQKLKLWPRKKPSRLT